MPTDSDNTQELSWLRFLHPVSETLLWSTLALLHARNVFHFDEEGDVMRILLVLALAGTMTIVCIFLRALYACAKWGVTMPRNWRFDFLLACSATFLLFMNSFGSTPSSSSPIFFGVCIIMLVIGVPLRWYATIRPPKSEEGDGEDDEEE